MAVDFEGSEKTFTLGIPQPVFSTVDTSANSIRRQDEHIPKFGIFFVTNDAKSCHPFWDCKNFALKMGKFF